MTETLRIGNIVRDSLVDGPGVRLVVATQGCDIHCSGCHNPELIPFDGGAYVSFEQIFSNISPLTTGLTISGGEPTCQIQDVILLLYEARQRGLNTMMYTGKTWPTLAVFSWLPYLLANLDYIKLGPYDESCRTLSTPYIGSSNQKIYRIVEGRLLDFENRFHGDAFNGEDHARTRTL